MQLFGCCHTALFGLQRVDRIALCGLYDDIAFGCIVAGVTEPCIYGVTFKLKKPMIGVMAGGLVGGIVAGLMHVKAYVMGYSTIMALPIFMDTAVSMAIAVVVGIAVAAAVTYIVGFDQDEAHV